MTVYTNQCISSDIVSQPPFTSSLSMAEILSAHQFNLLILYTHKKKLNATITHNIIRLARLL
jgi:hypothetical protein